MEIKQKRKSPTRKQGGRLGRKTVYVQELHDEWAWSLAAQGKIDKEISKAMGISTSILHLWKVNNASFSSSLKTGKDIADAKVVRALFDRATGFEYKEKKIVIEIDKDGNQKPARIETTERYLPPDVTACIFWLKNRRPAQWADRQINKIESEGKISVHVIDEEAMNAVQKLFNKS